MNFDYIKKYYAEYNYPFDDEIETDLIELHKMSLKHKEPIQKILGGRIVSIPKIEELERKKNVLKVLKLKCRKNTLVVNSIDKILTLTDEEILNNRLAKKFEFNQRTYDVGTKISKLLAKNFFHLKGDYKKDTNFLKVYNLKKESETFANEPNPVGEIKISIMPEHFLEGAFFGDSCYSPLKENEFIPLLMIRSNQWAVVYDEDWTSRMFLLIDPKRKIYMLSYTYPQHSATVVYSVDNFLQAKGLKRIDKGKDFFCQSKYYVDSTYNPYEELEDSENAIPIEGTQKTSYYAIEKYSMGCAITGNKKYEKSSLQYCEECCQYHPAIAMHDDYICEDCFI